MTSRKPKPRAKLGRPTSYNPAYCKQAFNFCLLGATIPELAAFFEVHPDTISEWQSRHPAFSEALKKGKARADADVANKLYRRATGYSHEAVKIFFPAGSKKPVYAKYVEHFPPDTTAMIFWLKNRRSATWRDQHDALAPTVNVNIDIGDLELAQRIAYLLMSAAPSPPLLQSPGEPANTSNA